MNKQAYNDWPAACSLHHGMPPRCCTLLLSDLENAWQIIFSELHTVIESHRHKQGVWMKSWYHNHSDWHIKIVNSTTSSRPVYSGRFWAMLSTKPVSKHYEDLIWILSHETHWVCSPAMNKQGPVLVWCDHRESARQTSPIVLRPCIADSAATKASWFMIP